MKSVFLATFQPALAPPTSSRHILRELDGDIFEGLAATSFIISEESSAEGKMDFLNHIWMQQPDVVLIFCTHPLLPKVTTYRNLFSPAIEFSLPHEDRILAGQARPTNFFETTDGRTITEMLEKEQIPASYAFVDVVTHHCSCLAYIAAGIIEQYRIATKLGLVLFPLSYEERNAPEYKKAAWLSHSTLVKAGRVICQTSIQNIRDREAH